MLGTIWRISVLVLIVATGCQSPETEPSDVVFEPEPITSYAIPSSLIEPEELLNQHHGFRLVDVRPVDQFSEGYIPGAVQVWRDLITDTSYAYGGMMATKAQMEALLSSLGILPSDTLVLYDAKADVDAARLWWILRYYGHKQIRLLNGGLKGWIAAGGELDTAAEARLKRVSNVTPYKFGEFVNPEIIASTAEVKSAVDVDSILLLDTRSQEEFSGEVRKKGAARAGAIPTAKNLDWSVAVNYGGDHRFKSAGNLQKIYNEVGIGPSTDVITYCHSGVRSAHTLFVLHQLLGYGYVRNYDGSWTEWSHLQE